MLTGSPLAYNLTIIHRSELCNAYISAKVYTSAGTNRGSEQSTWDHLGEGEPVPGAKLQNNGNKRKCSKNGRRGWGEEGVLMFRKTYGLPRLTSNFR